MIIMSGGHEVADKHLGDNFGHLPAKTSAQIGSLGAIGRANLISLLLCSPLLTSDYFRLLIPS